MTESKHTPGPWHYNLNIEKKKRKMVIYNDRSAIVAVIPSSRDDNKKVTLETMKADAALIAAAPELLEALKACKNAMQASDEGLDPSGLAWEAAFNEARAAIAKTKGAA